MNERRQVLQRGSLPKRLRRTTNLMIAASREIMNQDIYAEWLVKRKDPVYKIPFYIGVAFLFLLGLIASALYPFGFLLLFVAVGIAWFFGPRMKVEYEYVFVTNELEIDRIFSQRYRKKAQKIEMQKVDKVASMNSHEFDNTRQNPQIKVVDYSSGKGEAETYGISYSDDKGKFLFIIEPNDKILKCMKTSAPRKVMVDPKLLNTTK